jgi:hypothetical protein
MEERGSVGMGVGWIVGWVLMWVAAWLIVAAAGYGAYQFIGNHVIGG